MNPLDVRFTDSRANIKDLDIYWVDNGFQRYIRVKNMEEAATPVSQSTYPSNYGCIGIFESATGCELWPSDCRAWVIDKMMEK
jgi:hypothetical protein